ncbi:alpha-hydroxy acid oxidase [Actinosynnema mirum]|uniref:FMN-dependent alpha-hydroxy acid dehydrogenase n=1 Tax=Actinosynnema mirum (strain ATCC 29888 / DSM 43827 / JCM 3225 / NBRC 14064 / NCIMB 13271 / NRRL B-12336 / IMRU 3971 / 101) TaxID=446462 RepID=C6WLN8_ACTMD|nr:alpha-hydroxy acid oxidase [Actinosynnema mirum]ACU38431.1 FMN-dependent alpha-hydroxy acid dehydrogenase [Actinosynnema mirum DSM 43827]
MGVRNSAGGGAEDPEDLAEVERAAAARLPGDVRDFIAGGSGDEVTLAANRAALDDVALLPRVLAGVQAADTSTSLVGTAATLPVAVAPMGYQCLVHPDGEVAAAAAAGAAGVPFTVGTLSSRSVEEIAETGASLWFQLYWLRDRGLVAELVARAEAAGCRALVITVDVPVMGRRLRDVRNGFTLPRTVRAVHLADGPSSAHEPRQVGSGVAQHTSAVFDPAFGWRDLEWLRARTRLPLVVKGVLDPRDATRCVELGASAVVVSNHGGRQLDGAAPSAVALPRVVDAVAGAAEVLFDSGVRSGVDVLRALALGATGVLLGRPILWGLAVGGERGAARVLELLRTEFAQALLLAGCADVDAARGLATAQAAPTRRGAP